MPNLPFRDITHKFTASPLPRPRRKPKTPGGALGEKLRLRVIESTKANTKNAFPSSLPPSSPPIYPSSSHGLPILDSEDDVAQEMVEEEQRYEPSEFAFSMHTSDDEDAENRPPTPTNSDPFGFFVVERKLKAARAAAPSPPPPIALLRPSRVTDNKERDDGRVMPSTPHKPKSGKRGPIAEDLSSPVFTSPSPLKERTLLEDESEGAPTRRRQGRPRKTEDDEDEDDVPPKSKKARQSPEASLPQRRSTRARKPASKGKEKAAAPKPSKKRGRTAPTKRSVGKSKKTAADEDEDDNDKFETERQARLEYFRKLDDYSFEKEDVYVV